MSYDFFLFYLERDYNKLDPNKVILKVVTLSGFGLVSHPFWFLSQSRARIEPNLPLRDLWVVDLALSVSRLFKGFKRPTSRVLSSSIDLTHGKLDVWTVIDEILALEL